MFPNISAPKRGNPREQTSGEGLSSALMSGFRLGLFLGPKPGITTSFRDHVAVYSQGEALSSGLQDNHIWTYSNNVHTSSTGKEQQEDHFQKKVPEMREEADCWALPIFWACAKRDSLKECVGPYTQFFGAGLFRWGEVGERSQLGAPPLHSLGKETEFQVKVANLELSSPGFSKSVMFPDTSTFHPTHQLPSHHHPIWNIWATLAFICVSGHSYN